MANNGKITDLTDQAQALTQAQTPNSTAVPWSRPTEFIGQFGPGRPILPARPEEQPRLFEYMPGINMVSIPRHGFGLASFPMLRNLSVACKEIRLNIELIKREVRALDWEITPIDEKDKTDYSADIGVIQQYLETPDNYHDFDQWLNMLLEEMLSIDAVTIWPEKNRADQLVGLELVAGDTIRPLLDFRGRVAPPPLPAYVQMLHGLPTSYFDRTRLLYRPFNASTFSPYGTSPIEFIILVINLALRRDTYHVASFTEGNVPEALVGAPAAWTQDQIDTWQGYWDAIVQGNIAEQRKLHWVPLDGGRGQVPVYEFRKDDINQTPRDEWLMRLACWAFGNSPAEFGITPGAGLGGAGFSDSMENVQYRSMLGPITQYVSKLLNMVIRDWLQRPWLKFQWLGLDPQRDQLQQAQIDEIYNRMGVYDVTYIQDRLSIPSDLRPKQGAKPPTFFGGGFSLAPNVKPATMPAGNQAQDAAPRQAQDAASEEGAARKFFRLEQNGEWAGYG